MPEPMERGPASDRSIVPSSLMPGLPAIGPSGPVVGPKRDPKYPVCDGRKRRVHRSSRKRPLTGTHQPGDSHHRNVALGWRRLHLLPNIGKSLSPPVQVGVDQREGLGRHRNSQ
jgi:hypothetical protein